MVPRSQGTPPPPTREIMKHTSILREDIYRRRQPEGETIPIMLQPVSIVDGLPKGDKIVVDVRIIRTGRAGGPSGIKAEHLKGMDQRDNQVKKPEKVTL